MSLTPSKIALMCEFIGNEWSVMTHVKDVSEREMRKAMAQMGNAG